MIKIICYTGIFLMVLLFQEPYSMPLQSQKCGLAADRSDREAVPVPPEVINPEYKALLDEDNMLDMSGRCLDDLIDKIGEPRFVLRQGDRGTGHSKEIWILPIYQEDSTGLYLYFENGKVADWRLDTFMGLGNHPQLLEWFQ